MKTMIWLFITCMFILGACEENNLEREFKTGKRNIELPDTSEIKISDTLYFSNSNGWVTLSGVPVDSRCPINAQCVWAGNAVVDVNFMDGTSEYAFKLNTHPNYRNDTLIQGLYIKLLDVLPYPEAGEEMPDSEYMASLFITDDTSVINRPQHIGTVVDYTSLDGCDFIIELDNGKKLEPATYPDGFQFYDGQRVAINYNVLEDISSICLVGDIVKITTIENIGCTPYSIMPFNQSIDELPSDELSIKNVDIENGCLVLSVGYSGGCREHNITLVQMPLTCATPPLPKPVFYITHNANRDLCEAFITEELQFDLKPLMNRYPNGTDVTLMTPDKSYSAEFYIAL